MIPYIQSKYSSEDGKVHGSCFRTCIGSILEIDPETIPHFEDMDREWFLPFYKFLDDNGYEYEGMGIMSRDGIDGLKNENGVDGYVIVGGKSPRLHVTRGHAVIYKNGVMVHDPHPSNEGLTEIEHWYLIKRK